MKKIIALFSLIFSMSLQAGTVAVDSVRLWGAPDHTRLVFDVGGAIEHTIISLSQPERLVIDIKNACLVGKLPAAGDDRYVQALRSGIRNGNELRVVLDLKQPVRPKSVVLEPAGDYGHRLVVDLYGDDKVAAKSNTPAPRVSMDADRAAVNGLRDIIVAIDAGHGGEDVGAVGPSGAYEKNVVLAIARKLQGLVAAEPGMRAVMTRDGDYFVPLRKRMEIARQHKADIFISVHADAFRDARAQGASVYTISNRGASSEAARRLAERENASDLVGGVSLDGKDDILASVLLDLSQTATRQASMEAADLIYHQLKAIGKVHGPQSQQAGFVVLKAPDVPSLLVETAYISNPVEERKLKEPRHQERLAAAILAGVRGHFQNSPLPGTSLAARQQQRRHVISRGETLSLIAQQYQVSLASLRDTNKLPHDQVRVGQVLAIPGS